ncbi:lipopolysaccharide biosynthesis protein [Frankia sp. Cppng1_Ct_nod]|uniref:lipopolysaccharide biosynthesis protein n=1 Tax=Frankia sp. Cppng1_Ct_nod TaxID=2897162 RepID=UPI0013EF9D67|nr:lipopolysaccharide biosynthesis protein [Frankia sp. Cppng1_Ct_nod]
MSGSANDQLGKLVRKGALWTTLNVGLTRFGQFGIGIVVARIIDPNAFGVFAVALTVLNIVINVSELGVSAALIRGDAEDERRIAPTVATISVLTSSTLSLLMVALAPDLSRLLGAADATDAVRVLSITVFLAGFGAVPSALLKRDFRQDRQFVADTASLVVSTALILPLAMAGWGAMALAWSRAGGQVVAVLILIAYSTRSVRFGFKRSEARDLLVFGLPLTGSNIVGFLLINIDYIVIGRKLGAVPLGLYTLAFNMSGWPMNVFSSVVRSVALPAFARIREDTATLPKRFTGAAGNVAAVTFPVCAIMAGLATPLIVGVYGEKWRPAAAVLVWLAVLGALRTVIELCLDFVVALGRTRWILNLQLLWLIALTPAMVIGVDADGIVGAGIVHSLVTAGIVLPACVWMLRLGGITPALFVRALATIIIAAVGAGTLAHLVAARVANPWLGCVAGGLVGVAAYAAMQRRRTRILVQQLASRRNRNRVSLPDPDRTADPEGDPARTISTVNDYPGLPLQRGADAMSVGVLVDSPPTMPLLLRTYVPRARTAPPPPVVPAGPPAPAGPPTSPARGRRAGGRHRRR